jgi:hypothetical protein
MDTIVKMYTGVCVLYCVHVMTYNIVKLNHQIIIDTIAWSNQIACRL